MPLTVLFSGEGSDLAILTPKLDSVLDLITEALNTGQTVTLRDTDFMSPEFHETMKGPLDLLKALNG